MEFGIIVGSYRWVGLQSLLFLTSTRVALSQSLGWVLGFDNILDTFYLISKPTNSSLVTTLQLP